MTLSVLLPVSSVQQAIAQGNGTSLNDTDSSNPTVAPQNRLLPADNDPLLKEFQHSSLEATFEAIAKKVRFEPYTGVRRGELGTAIAQSGNSLDQSILLAQQARNLGFTVRFVQGRLSSANKEILLRGMFPSDIAGADDTVAEDRYDPWSDNSLLDQVYQHYWLEVLLNGDWIALDPSFPRAKAGESYATVEQHWSEVPDNLYQQVKVDHQIKLNSGKTVKLGSIQISTAELGMAPIELMSLGIPLVEELEEAQVNKFSAMAGALGGASAKPKDEDNAEPVALAARYSSQFSWLAENVENEPFQVPLVQDSQSVSEEWIEFSISAPRTSTRSIKRWLFRATKEAHRPEPYRHYTISLLAHQVPELFTESAFNIASQIDWEVLEKEAEKTQSIDELIRLNRTVSSGIGLLSNLTVAANADSLTDNAALQKGLVPVYATPRIYIHSIMGANNAETSDVTTIDLRLDEIDVYPFPDYSASSAYWFQQGRGIQQSALERNVLARLQGSSDAISTTRVMQASLQLGEELLVINKGNADQFNDNVAFSRIDKRLIETSLANGNDIILPSSPVTINGSTELGWWDVDTQSGRITGVMESGEHQAAVESIVTTSNTALGDANGFALGMISGANSTQLLVMAKLLSTGELTAEDLKEITATAKDIACSSCFSGSVSLEASITSGTDCFEIFEASIGKSKETPKLPFCDAYGKGFECAISMVLNGADAFTDIEVTLAGEAGFKNSCDIE